MNFIQQLELWAKGDALQGKWMLIFGGVLIFCLIYIFKSNNPLLRGMLIPLSILMLINLGYGGFLAFYRPNHIESTILLFQKQPEETLQKELIKAQNDSKTYDILKPIWGILICICIGLFFIFSKDFYKSILLGLLVLFSGVLFVDTFLHHRLQPYLHLLKEIT